MKVNENAPAIAAGEIRINADVETVWDLMADVNRWPDWNLDVEWAKLEGDLVVGSEFRWKAGPGSIRSTLQRVERPRLLAWTGRTLGIHAVHVWQLDPQDGDTLVSTRESWEGLVVRIFRRWMQKQLQDAIDAGLRYLKVAAEYRSAQ
jgi:hypothetical protein